MAFKTEKTETGTDIVISGFEYAIAASPHKGIGNIKNANIATEEGELMCSYSRVQQSQGIVTNGTLGYLSTNSLSITSGSSSHVFCGSWIQVTASSISGLSTGTYYVISNGGAQSGGLVLQLSSSYSTSSADIITGFSAGGSATFSTIYNMGQAVQSATERYTNTSGAVQYRYYVLDTNGRIWVHDTATYSGLDTPYWALPATDTLTQYGGGTTRTAGGISVLNGWILITGGDKIFALSTGRLGSNPSTTFGGNTNSTTMSAPATTNPQKMLTGHQGRSYYVDGNYIGSIFPDTSLITNVANIQSYCSYTASTVTGTISAILSGSIPFTYQADGTSTQRIPVVFFTTTGGTQPTNLTAGTIYYLEYQLGTPLTFKVYDTLTDDTVTATGTFSGSETSATLTANWPYPSGAYATSFSNGDERTVTYTNGATSATWTGGLSGAATATMTIVGGAAINIATGAAGTQYFNTFYPISTDGVQTMTFTRQRVNLPTNEIGTCLAEIGNTVIIGTQSNALYPWNQIDPLPSSLISLPESNTQQLLTVNQVAYVFAGNKGNIYITDGSVASLVLKVPDYCAGIPGSPSTYIEPYFTWGGSMYLRGRVYFSILDQTSSKAGNCGGVWSFYPTQNLASGQDTGLALRLENVNSYGSYNGVATVLIPNQTQTGNSPLFWSAWYSDVTSPTYGIDYTNAYPGNPKYGPGTYTTVIETDIVPVGTVLSQYNPKQIEYKLSTPLAETEVVSVAWRKNGTDSFTSLGTAVTESSTSLSGYFPANFQGAQWVQLQATLTPTDRTSVETASSFVRLTELRIR